MVFICTIILRLVALMALTTGLVLIVPRQIVQRSKVLLKIALI